MRKLKTKGLFNSYLDEEFAWRLKEIADMRGAIASAEQTPRNSIVRASIPILYAHWEGFVKKSSEGLLNFINNQGLQYNLLRSCFVVFGIKNLLAQMIESGNPVDSIAVVDFFRVDMTSRAELVVMVQTDANLSSKVFERIANSLGVDTGPYETKYLLIDHSLLKRRNNIAHGEFLDVNDVNFRDLSEDVIALMRRFKDDLSNIVSADRFLQH